MTVWEANVTQELASESVQTAPSAEPATTGTEEQPASYNKIEALKELTFRILHEVQSMREVGAPSIDSGIDFYDEVTRFEIDLIKRALQHTRGHQGRAARLLNLKITTLNSKIKHYGIQLDGFITGFSNPLPPKANMVNMSDSLASPAV